MKEDNNEAKPQHKTIASNFEVEVIEGRIETIVPVEKDSRRDLGYRFIEALEYSMRGIEPKYAALRYFISIHNCSGQFIGFYDFTTLVTEDDSEVCIDNEEGNILGEYCGMYEISTRIEERIKKIAESMKLEKVIVTVNLRPIFLDELIDAINKIY